MSEQNILNPSPTSSLNPDYTTPVKVTDPQLISRWQAKSGRPYNRRLAARGQVFDLTWTKRMFADYLTLQQWWRQYENDFFTFADWDTGRYHSGMFADQPTAQREANNQVTINAQFVVVPTLPMFQYPSNWAQDAIFMEERSSWPIPPGALPTANDLVKLTPLTGGWDHRDQNYLLQSQELELSPWTTQNGCVVAADQIAGPDGTITADKLTAGGVATSTCFQTLSPVFPEFYSFSIYVRAGTATQIAIGIFGPSGWEPVSAQIISGPGSVSGGSPALFTALTSSWTRIAITTNNLLTAGGAYNCHIFPGGNVVNTQNNYTTAAQVEVGTAVSTYTITTTSSVTLNAPSPNAKYHGGFAYFDNGTITSDAAEWLYFGYGFQLWSPKGPAMGIVSVSLDRFLQGTGDLYASALTASAPVFTVTNVQLGLHRVTLNPTNTKNASSSGFIVCADAIQVMR